MIKILILLGIFTAIFGQDMSGMPGMSGVTGMLPMSNTQGSPNMAQGISSSSNIGITSVSTPNTGTSFTISSSNPNGFIISTSPSQNSQGTSAAVIAPTSPGVIYGTTSPNTMSGTVSSGQQQGPSAIALSPQVTTRTTQTLPSPASIVAQPSAIMPTFAAVTTAPQITGGTTTVQVSPSPTSSSSLSVRCSKTPNIKNPRSFSINLIQLKLSQAITKLGGYYYNTQIDQCLSIRLPPDSVVTTNFFSSRDTCVNACQGRATLADINLDPSIECIKPGIIGTGSGVCIDFSKPTYSYNPKTQTCESVNVNCGDVISNNIFISKKTCNEFCHGVTA